MMKRLFLLSLLLLTACKPATPAATINAPDAAAEAEALDYVRLVNIAAVNANLETGKPIPATHCTDPLFGMKKTTKFLKLERCMVKYNSDQNYTVAALFNGDLAVMSDARSVRRVKPSELPEVK